MSVFALENPRSLRLTIPALTLFLSIIIDALPLPHAGPTATAPVIMLATLFFWLVHRPGLVPPYVVFAASLLLDAWTHLPLGMTALALLAATALLLPKDRFLAGSPFIVVWLCFALAAALVFAMRWLIACLYWERLVPAGTVAFEWLLTFLFYPAVSACLVRVMRLLPRYRHAPGK